MEWFYNQTTVRFDGETIHCHVAYEEDGRDYSQAYEQTLTHFLTRGPARLYPFYETDMPLEVVQGICGGTLPGWWKPLLPLVVKVFDAARSPRDATKDLESLFLADVPVDELDGCGFTPIWYAARYGEPESVRALLGCGARADRLFPHIYGYESLLHAAVSRGYPDLVTRLLKCGLDPNLRDSLGKPPIHYLEEKPTAFRRTARQVAEALLSAGAILGDAPEVLRKHSMKETADWLSSLPS